MLADRAKSLTGQVKGSEKANKNPENRKKIQILLDVTSDKQTPRRESMLAHKPSPQKRQRTEEKVRKDWRLCGTPQAEFPYRLQECPQLDGVRHSATQARCELCSAPNKCECVSKIWCRCRTRRPFLLAAADANRFALEPSTLGPDNVLRCSEMRSSPITNGSCSS
jgi:hypothetical protein